MQSMVIPRLCPCILCTDTLWLMGLRDEFRQAQDWVARDLTFNNAHDVSVFETTIRELGGLLSAYDLTRETIFKDKVLLASIGRKRCSLVVSWSRIGYRGTAQDSGHGLWLAVSVGVCHARCLRAPVVVAWLRCVLLSHCTFFYSATLTHLNSTHLTSPARLYPIRFVENVNIRHAFFSEFVVIFPLVHGLCSPF